MSAASPKRRLFRLIVTLTVALFLGTILVFVAGGEAVERWAAARIAEPGTRASLGAAIALLLAGDIVLPVPSSLLATAAGAAFGFVGGALLAGVSLAVGAVAGLVVARRLGRRRVRAMLGAGEFGRLEAMLGRYAPLVVMVCRPVPVLAETSVLVAGALGASPVRLALPLALSSLAVGGAYAWLGAFAQDRATFVAVFAASCLLPSLAWAVAGALLRPRR